MNKCSITNQISSVLDRPELPHHEKPQVAEKKNQFTSKNIDAKKIHNKMRIPQS